MSTTSNALQNTWPQLQQHARENDIHIIGVDEAGRGPLFGPVVAGAVLLADPNPIEGLACSKKLSEKKREYLYSEVQGKSVAWAIAQASVEEIDRLNILQASLLAMHRAVDQVIEKAALSRSQCLVLVDGNKIPNWAYRAQAIVKGDEQVPAISAGSILAKVWRDEWCCQQAEIYPQYDLHKHMGYPTAHHMALLKQYGPSDLHRRSFKPVRQLIELEQGALN